VERALVDDVEVTVVSLVEEDVVVAVVVGVRAVVATVVGTVAAGAVAARVAVVVSSWKSDGRPGRIGSLARGERTFGPIWGPDGGAVVVVDISVTSLTSAS